MLVRQKNERRWWWRGTKTKVRCVSTCVVASKTPHNNCHGGEKKDEDKERSEGVIGTCNTFGRIPVTSTRVSINRCVYQPLLP